MGSAAGLRHGLHGQHAQQEVDDRGRGEARQRPAEGAAGRPRVPRIVGSEGRPGDGQGDHHVDRQPELLPGPVRRRHHPVPCHLEEEVGGGRQDQPHRVAAERAHEAERVQRQGGGRGARHQDEDGSRHAGEDLGGSVGDDEDLHGSPSDALRHVERRGDPGAADPEQSAQEHHRRRAGLRPPARREDASRTEPRTVPNRMATTAAPSVSGGRSATGCSTKTAATGMVRVMPRFPHRETWSHSPRARGGSSSRVTGASVEAKLTGSVADIHPPYAGITRQVRAVGGSSRPLSP